MKLINTTNSHAALVKSQLASTDALLVEVYSAGNTDVVFTQAPTHYELLISNKHRAIRETEVEKIREFFLKRTSFNGFYLASNPTATASAKFSSTMLAQ